MLKDCPYQLTRVRHLAAMSHETPCYQARVLCDGVAVGVVRNDGQGGPNLLDLDTPAARAAFDRYCADVGRVRFAGGFATEADDDSLMAVLFERWELDRLIARARRKLDARTLFRLPEDGPGDYREVLTPWGPAVRAYLARKYEGRADVLNEGAIDLARLGFRC